MTRKNSAGWEILSDHLYEAFPIMSIFRSTRRNPRTGQTVDFVRVVGLDWANVIALTPRNEVVLVRQYRHGSEESTLEMPGGCVEPGEDPKLSALRELSEETGYSSSEIEHLGIVRPNPALLSNSCSIYVARNVVRCGEQSLDPGEDITVLTKPLPEVYEMIRRGEITHAMVLAAFALYRLHEKI